MARILYLVHRMPYPPNKGDKVRSYHLLRHLAAAPRGAAGHLRRRPRRPAPCAHAEPLVRRGEGRVAAATARACGQPDRPAARRAADAGLLPRMPRCRPGCRACVRAATSTPWSCSRRRWCPTAPASSVPVLVDFVDVDSAKWTEYARNRPWPMSWLYAREGRTLLAYEQAVAARRATRSFLVTQQEVDLFERLAPDVAGHVQAVGNGVDAEFFAPDPALAVAVCAPTNCRWCSPARWTTGPTSTPSAGSSPRCCPRCASAGRRCVSTSSAAAPRRPCRRWPAPHVNVTGTVPDVRPYLQHAAAVVAPLRLARGVQNKVLEAMAMARPVVAAAHCAAVLDATARRAPGCGRDAGRLRDRSRAPAV